MCLEIPQKCKYVFIMTNSPICLISPIGLICQMCQNPIFKMSRMSDVNMSNVQCQICSVSNDQIRQEVELTCRTETLHCNVQICHSVSEFFSDNHQNQGALPRYKKNFWFMFLWHHSRERGGGGGGLVFFSFFFGFFFCY